MKPDFAVVAALALLAMGASAQASKTSQVEVENTSTNPVPTTQVGTSSVNVVNTPSVNVASMPQVNVGSMPAVTIAGTPSVTLAGTPAVTLTGSPSVTFLGTPLVGIAGTPSVTLANIPTVALQGAPNVTLAGIPTVKLDQTPFQGGMHVTIQPGQSTGTATFTVPQYFRAVIEISVINSEGDPSEMEGKVFVESGLALGDGGSGIPLTMEPALFGSRGVLHDHLYAAPGSTVTCLLFTSNPGSQRDANCTFSGYLVSDQ